MLACMDNTINSATAVASAFRDSGEEHFQMRAPLCAFLWCRVTHKPLIMDGLCLTKSECTQQSQPNHEIHSPVLLEFEGQSGEQGVSALRDCMSKHDSGARTEAAAGHLAILEPSVLFPFSDEV